VSLVSGACSGKSERNEPAPATGGRAGSGPGGTTGDGGEAAQGTGGSAGSAGKGTGGSAGSAGKGAGGTDGCVPTTCEAEDAECGELDDGCGDTLDCGGCPDQETCGGDGEANVCGSGCVPETCENAGIECGELDDGCGDTLDCGTCEGGCGCNEDGQCDAGPEQSVERSSTQAASSGFAGTEAEYTALYSLPCSSEADCIVPCIENGGTDAMCAAGMCVDSDPDDYCLPSTIWTDLDQLATEGTSTIDCAELVLVSDPYLDYLLLTDFGFDIPGSAEVLGISVRVRRAGGTDDVAADAGVHLIKASVLGDADRSSAGPWPGPELAEANYGGPTDLWEEELTPEDVNSPDFGVALATEFTQGIGNGRAYVDIVYMTVHYRIACSGDS
jgi:hypothetical protein